MEAVDRILLDQLLAQDCPAGRARSRSAQVALLLIFVAVLGGLVLHQIASHPRNAPTMTQSTHEPSRLASPQLSNLH